VFGALSLYILSSAALIVLRRKEPALDRPYRAPLYPLTPLVALALSLVCMVAMAVSHPWHLAIFAAILGFAWLGFATLVRQ
jgi:ethanolamine permease